MSIGRHLHDVLSPPFPCPACGYREPMAVYETVARWACGHTRLLPPLKQPPGPPARTMGTGGLGTMPAMPEFDSWLASIEATP